MGFPFTANITLPIVNGSTAIAERLSELNVTHEYYPAGGEGHEYYGVIGGIWAGGPNDYFYEIQSQAYNFLYNFIGFNIIGDINEDGLINVIDVLNIVNSILNSEPYLQNYDLNNDGIIDVLDIINIVNIILDNN